MSSPSPETFDIRLDSLLQVFSGLQNPYTGMGNPYVDPTQHTWIQPGLSRLSRQEQSALVRQSGLLKKLTTNLPKAATWRWGRTTLANGNAKLLQAIADAVNGIPVVTPLQRIGKTRKGYQVAGELALQTGNSGFILDVDDGKKLDEPLDRKNLKRINKLALLSRHTLRPDISTLSNGLPEHFIVLNAYNLKEYSNGQRIHRSRVHWFRGVPILDDFDLIANNGCDDSILELVRDAWYLYQPAVQAAGRMLTDFDVPVRKVKDLAQNLADRGDEYKAELQSRLQVDQISRSNYRTQVVDMDNEALDHWTRQVTGMADLLGVTKDNFLGNIDVPPAVAFGEFASGLNSTGKSTTEKQLWNEAAAQFQIDKYDDNIQGLQEIVCLCKDGPTNGDIPDGLGWEWLSPYPPDAVEQADLELKRAQLIQDLNGVDPLFGPMAIAATYGQKEYNDTITLTKPYADYLKRKIDEGVKPQPTEPDVSALQDDQPGAEDQQTPDAPDSEGGDQQEEDDQQKADEAIADDILNDRTLLDSTDSDRLDSKYSHINFTPPSSVRNAFKRGLGLHQKGLTGGGLEPSTVRVAKAIASGKPVTPEQVRKGYRWFSRNQRFVNAPKDSPAWASWMLWGGSDGGRWYNKLYRQIQAADQRTDSGDTRLDATRAELLAKAKAKNEGLEKGKKYNTFGKSNAAIAEFVGEGTAQQTTTKTGAKPKGGTQKGKYQTKQTSSAIAQAIAKKTGADAEVIEQDLRGKIQKAIDKTRREARKSGKEPTDKELRAAARAVVKVEATSAIASARGEVRPTTKKNSKIKKVSEKEKTATSKTEEASTKTNNKASADEDFAPSNQGFVSATKTGAIIKKLHNLSPLPSDASASDKKAREKVLAKYQKEINLTQKASDLGIGPKIYNKTDNSLELEDLRKDYAHIGGGGKDGWDAVENGLKQVEHKTLVDLDKKIATLHKNGILHGDLGVANTFINKKDGSIKLIDFGGSEDFSKSYFGKSLDKLSKEEKFAMLRDITIDYALSSAIAKATGFPSKSAAYYDSFTDPKKSVEEKIKIGEAYLKSLHHENTESANSEAKPTTEAPTKTPAKPTPAKKTRQSKAKTPKAEENAKSTVEAKAEKKARSAKAPKAEPKTAEGETKAKSKDKAISEAKPKESIPVAEKVKGEARSGKAKAVEAKPQSELSEAEKAVAKFNEQKVKDIETAIAQYKAMGIPTKQLTDRDIASKTQKVLGEGISGIVYEHEGQAVKYSNHSLDSFGFEGMHAAAQLGIAPKVIAVDPAQSAFAMELLKGYKTGYSSEANGSLEDRKHTETFISQLKKANERGFFVNDLHDENVMHNPQTGDVKFIDQGGFRKVSSQELAGQVLDIDGSQNGGRPMAPRAIQTYVQTHGTAIQKREYKKILKEYKDSIPENAEINALFGKKTKPVDHADLVKRTYVLLDQVKANPTQTKGKR